MEDPVKKVWERCDGVGADVVIECAGTKVSCEQSVMMARTGGKVVMAALASEPITIPWTTLTLAEVDLIGVRANPNTNEQALALMANGTVNAGSILTHTFPLEKFGEALETFVERRGGAMKVVLHP
ncbi:MAG: zinc-binding dehydrogenase [Thermoleophilia bacterium]|nr:zinc-binding dehydrogenase [Thermoleophilia bacterium]